MAFANVMTPRQARAARAALGLSLDALAEQSTISVSSIRRIEAGSARLDTLAKLQEHYQGAGLTFIKTANMHGVAWRPDSR